MITVLIRDRNKGGEYERFREWESAKAVLDDLRQGSQFATIWKLTAVGEPMHFPEFFTIDVEWLNSGKTEAVTLLVPQ